MKVILKLKNYFKNLAKIKNARQTDKVEVCLPGLTIKMSRNIDLDTPHEVTVVIPRAEMRKRCNEDCRKCDYELIYSSITVVHAPRHPLAGPSSFTSKEIQRTLMAKTASSDKLTDN